MLYIPIWFYSNKKDKLLGIMHAHFTFQSGSIQIDFISGISILKVYFTFQSGSIQINRRWIHLAGKDLYIPIWFYSNGGIINPSRQRLKLYIPIWFYSNCRRRVAVICRLFLYIPIWFYSNIFQSH